MLKPALLFEEEILERFTEGMYSERMFYYIGNLHDHILPNLDPVDNVYKWAIVDSKDDLVGYFSYAVDPFVDSVDRFGLYSFKPGCVTVAKDTFSKLEELISSHHRVSWRVVEGNPAFRNYASFCMMHDGKIAYFSDVTIDRDGKYRGEYVFEIINPKICCREQYAPEGGNNR